MLGETFAYQKKTHFYALVLSNFAWNWIYEWSPIINFCQDDHKLCIKHELKKKNKLKVFTSICFPVFTLIYI